MTISVFCVRMLPKLEGQWSTVFGRRNFAGFCLITKNILLGFEFWVLGFGFWIAGFGFWVLGFGFWVLGFCVFWVLGFG